MIDVINLQTRPKTNIVLKPVPAQPNQLPGASGELLLSNSTTIGELAALLGLKPFKIIADLMQLGVFASVNQTLSFDVLAKLVPRYGYIAKKSP